MKPTKLLLKSLLLLAFVLISCGGDKEQANEGVQDPLQNKGIGPVKSVTLTADVDQKLAKEGEVLFEAKCSACHKFDERVVGPALKGVTQRRSPEWIMNMILNPQEMTKNDPIGQELLAEYMTQMVYQNITEEETRKILEYFRKMDSTN